MTQSPFQVFPLYDYESRFIRDSSRLKLWLKGRQIGGSVTATLDIVLHAIATGEPWITMSRSQRQAKSLLTKAARHVRAIDRWSRQKHGTSVVADIGSERIDFRNGAHITAVPCDPDTTVGETSNWLLDEFALFPRSRELYGIVKPSIMHGKRMVIVSTPRGKDNKFYDLIQEAQGGSGGYSLHTTTIKDAFEDGIVLYDNQGRVASYETFRLEQIADVGEDMYFQEYEGVFSDELHALLTWSLVTACQDSRISIHKTPAQLRALNRPLYVGIDIGRRRDLTVIWVLSKNGDEHTTEAVIVLDRATFPEQQVAIEGVMATGLVAALRIDEQGNGMQLAEHFTAAHPLTAKGISFTNPRKQEMAGRLKTYLEARNLWLPDDTEIARDLTSVRRNITPSGNLQLTANRSTGSHADRFWALALALEASATHRIFECGMAL